MNLVAVAAPADAGDAGGDGGVAPVSCWTLEAYRSACGLVAGLNADFDIDKA